MISAISSTSTLATKLDISKMQARREEMFAKMDTNGDGTIDKAEFTAFAQQAPQANSTTDGKPSAEEMFTQMDTDGDGSVSKAEFEAFKPPKRHEAQGAMKQNDLAKMFSKIDTDGDGTISKSEFETFLEQLEEQATSGSTESQTGSTATNNLADYLNQDSSETSATYQSSGLNTVAAAQSTLDLVG